MTRIDEILAAQDSLPMEIRRTREQIESDEQAQELRRASFGRGHLTEEELNISRGMTLEKIALGNLGLDGVDRETEEIRLAQGLELQGRFQEAAKVHPDEGEQERLLAIDKAIDADDGTFCDCPAVSTEINGKQVEVQPQYEIKRVYSRRHNKMVSLVGCKDCGEVNATATPPEQLQGILDAHRTAAIAKKPTQHEHEVLK